MTLTSWDFIADLRNCVVVFILLGFLVQKEIAFGCDSVLVVYPDIFDNPRAAARFGGSNTSTPVLAKLVYVAGTAPSCGLREFIRTASWLGAASHLGNRGGGIAVTDQQSQLLRLRKICTMSLNGKVNVSRWIDVPSASLQAQSPGFETLTLGVEPGLRAPKGVRTASSCDEEGSSGPAAGEVNCAGPRAASMHGAQKRRDRVATASTTPRFGVWDPCENLGSNPMTGTSPRPEWQDGSPGISEDAVNDPNFSAWLTPTGCLSTVQMFVKDGVKQQMHLAKQGSSTRSDLNPPSPKVGHPLPPGNVYDN